MKRLSFALCAIACIASLLGMAAVVHQNAVQTFGVVSGLPGPALDRRPASIAGLNVALEQYADLEPVLGQIGAFHWLRQTFRWDQIEPSRGSYDWQKWDRIVAQSASHGHALIAVLSESPAWARAATADPTGPPLSPADFAAFAGQFAARYGSQIDVYQIWDEPNILLGWGGQPPSPPAYAALLQAGYSAIHAADPNATVIAGALAPTTETGPDNLSDLLFLQQLYDLGAGRYFDAAAGKPYGFYTGPEDRQADPAILNFSRFALLRQVMERNGDGHKLLWGGNFGWNTQPSPWGQTSTQGQVADTLGAFARAEAEWPWAGVLALENLQPVRPPDDPHWGFALLNAAGQPMPLLPALNARYSASSLAMSGNYGAQHPAAVYTGAWKFSDLGADIPQDFAQASLTLTFRGSDLALTVRRADYRGYLYVTVDGQPANLLPRDQAGAYLVLTAPEANVPQVTSVPVAAGLDPDQVHTAVIKPDRGWDQWAIAGFSVGRAVPPAGRLAWLSLLALAAVLSGWGTWRFGRRLDWGNSGLIARGLWARLGTAGQIVVTGAVGGLLYLTSWLTWGNDVIAVSRRFGDTWPIAVTALTAGLFYFSPSLVLALLSLAALFVLFYLRLDLALAFIALVMPLYLQYQLLWQRGFSLVEVFTLLAFAAWLLQNIRPLLAGLAAGRPRAGNGRGVQPQRAASQLNAPTGRWAWRSLSFLDWAVIAYLLVATISLAGAELKAVAIRDYRLVMIEPVLFYLLLRATPLDRRALWRIADFFIVGAVFVALVGLYQYVSGTNLITAEEGVARIRSVYGSPNNLALYLGRALPVALATSIIGGDRWRRIAYAIAGAVIGITIVLTFSKGALLLGVPAALAVVLVAWLGRRGWLIVGGGVAAAGAGVPLLAGVPRFAGLLDLTRGTSFFRVQLWVSAWRMFLDHPWFGVGPDNFLQLYRSRYILPDAWQEPNLSHPHNIALDFLSRVGLLGALAGAWMIAGFWWIAVRVTRQLTTAIKFGSPEARADGRALLALTAGLMGLIADMLAHGLVDHSFFLVDLSFVFFLALAAIQHVRRLASAAMEAESEGKLLARPIVD
jgi:O-antigen ligase